jgi:hypothetical protein
MEVLPISEYQVKKRERDQKLYGEYKKLVASGVPSYTAIRDIQDRSEKICGTKIHAFETIYRIIRPLKMKDEKDERKRTQLTA